ncbi:MAG: hydrogenase maturation protease [bacterium]|nr:hydrogenase maturation protease [bacterium]
MKRICVICIGNILLADEGVGPAIAKRMIERYEFPENVSVEDCACMGLALLPEFEENDLLVVVDAVDGTGEPAGTVFRFSPDDIDRSHVIHSAHDMRFSDVRDAAKMLGYEVEGICVGVQVEDISPAEFEIGLSESVESALPLAIQTVLSILLENGVEGIIEKDSGLEVCAGGELREPGGGEIG